MIDWTQFTGDDLRSYAEGYCNSGLQYSSETEKFIELSNLLERFEEFHSAEEFETYLKDLLNDLHLHK